MKTKTIDEKGPHATCGPERNQQDGLTLLPATAVVNEIRQLHAELQGLARTSLDKAIRIGELLAGVKAGLKHGRWLLWLKENVEFDPKTAQRYMGLFTRRDEFKNDTVSNLSDAYRLLAEPKSEPSKKQKPDARFIPPPGRGLTGHCTFNGRGWRVFIEPATAGSFFHVAVHCGNDHNEASFGSVDATKKPVRQDFVELTLDLLFGTIGYGWKKAEVEWSEYEIEPQPYNRWFYYSRKDYLEHALGIRPRNATTI